MSQSSSVVLLKKQEWLSRLVTGLVLLGLIQLLFVCFDGWWFSWSITVIASLVMREWSKLCRIRDDLALIVWLCMLSIPLISALGYHWNNQGLLSLSLVIGLVSAIATVISREAQQSKSSGVWLLVWLVGCCFQVIGWWSVCQLFSNQRQILYALVLLVVIADTAGYAVGKTWGYGQPFPELSPKKTWTGTLAMCLSVPLVIGLLQYGGQWPLMDLLSMGFFYGLGVFALLGDLTISLVKRQQAVKDTGCVLPGHGGLLDRLDSHLMVWALFALMQWEWLKPLP